MNEGRNQGHSVNIGKSFDRGEYFFEVSQTFDIKVMVVASIGCIESLGKQRDLESMKVRKA